MNGHDVASPHGPLPADGTAEQVELALNDILISAPFRNSQQAQRLLRYVVERSLAHEEHLLRERVIGSVIFSRAPDYDTGSDPVVRIRASEVRKRLAQYYYQASQSQPRIVIDIPPGSYRAQFRWQGGLGSPGSTPQGPEAAGQSTTWLEVGEQPHPEASSGNELTSLETHQPQSRPEPLVPGARVPMPGVAAQKKPGRALVYLIAVCGLLVVLGAALGGWWHARGSEPFTSFWRPWVSSPRPVLIAVGSNAVYRLSEELTTPYRQEHHLQTHGEEFFIPLAPNAEIKGRDIQPAEDSFVALGDVAATSAVVAALTAQRQPYEERFPNDISFVELRDHPSVLIGGFNNPMTIELTKHLPFVLASRTELDDTVHGRRWILNASEDSHDTEDYAIITRLVQRGGDGPVMSVAGMGQYGTLAAANFIVNPETVAALAKTLPHGWANRNLQIVLHLKVVDFKPTAVDVIGTQVW